MISRRGRAIRVRPWRGLAPIVGSAVALHLNRGIDLFQESLDRLRRVLKKPGTYPALLTVM